MLLKSSNRRRRQTEGIILLFATLTNSTSNVWSELSDYYSINVRWCRLKLLTSQTSVRSDTLSFRRLDLTKLYPEKKKSTEFIGMILHWCCECHFLFGCYFRPQQGVRQNKTVETKYWSFYLHHLLLLFSILLLLLLYVWIYFFLFVCFIMTVSFPSLFFHDWDFLCQHNISCQ